MSDTSTTAQEALVKLRERAAEHDSSKHEADQEYGAGIRDAITALEPALADPSKAPAALAYLNERAAEHASSKDEAYQEYAAGIRDAITALEPFLKDGSAVASPAASGFQK